MWDWSDAFNLGTIDGNQFAARKAKQFHKKTERRNLEEGIEQ